VDDFEDVAAFEGRGCVCSAGDYFPIALDGDGSLREPEMFDEAAHAEALGYFASFAIDGELHDAARLS
jgi:hypothetical protein